MENERRIGLSSFYRRISLCRVCKLYGVDNPKDNGICPMCMPWKGYQRSRFKYLRIQDE